MKGFVGALSGVGTEFRSVMRGLIRKPGYAIAAWVMLGLAIAANAAVFAIVWGFLLKPLPYPNARQLSIVGVHLPKYGINAPLMSGTMYLSLKKNVRGIASAGLATGVNGQPVRIHGNTHLLNYEQVTPSLFRTLGVKPVLGRLPAHSAGEPGGPKETVISYALWQSVFGGARDVLGQSFKVNNKTYHVVGVMPPHFLFEEAGVQAWLPFVIAPQRARSGGLHLRAYRMVVRRKPDVSAHQLNLELSNYSGRMLAKFKPAQRTKLLNYGFRIDAGSIHADELMRFGMGDLPWLMQAAAGLLLLLALANTINLALVRQRSRGHEFALRRALGASGGRLVRLILVEHVPIALAVGAVATLLAWVAVNTLHAFGLPGGYSPFEVELAPAVIAFTWILAAVATLVVTAGPALLARGRRSLLKVGHGPTVAGGRGSRRLQRALGTVQVALACALVVAGGTLGVSLWKVLTQPVGFAPERVVVAAIATPHGGRKDAWSALKPQLGGMPGVASFAAGSMIPFSEISIRKGGVQPTTSTEDAHVVSANLPNVTSNFFAALGVKFAAGRGFTRTEVASNAPVVVINDALARRFFGGADKAIGQYVDVRGGKRRIVGVSRDIAWHPEKGLAKARTVWLPWRGDAGGMFFAVVKVRGSTSVLKGELRNVIKTTLPDSALVRLLTLPHVVQAASTFRSAGAGMVAAFAILALLLAALGVFAITSFIARARLGEYGIRAALGAGPFALLRLGFREAGWLLIIGLPIGLAGAYLLGRVIASVLYKTPVLDPWLYVVGAVVITTVVFAAAWGPACRAARVPVRDLLGGGGTR